MEKRRADLIADQLEEMIFDGTFADGDRLDEISLSEHFGVSRTPLREALQRLTVTGLAEQLPRRGVFVRQPGPVELVEMFEVMAEMEAVCARLAALRISDAALVEIGDLNAGCEVAVAQNDSDRYYRENERFHQMLYLHAGNSVLEQECLRLQRRLKPYRRVQLKLRGRMQQSLAEHREILASLTAGDANRAADAMRAHVAVQGDKFRHLMASLKTAAQ